jgi:hypothetical protein
VTRVNSRALVSFVWPVTRDTRVGGFSCEARGIVKPLLKDCSPSYSFSVFGGPVIEFGCSY